MTTRSPAPRCWEGRKVTVTGGAGFLGSVLVRRLRSLGAEVFVVRSADYDLTSADAARRMYRDAQPELLFHLAASVGGIGANEANPGRFFYENMAMGLNVIEQGRAFGRLGKLVFVGTTCSYPKFTPVPFREDDLWEGFPEETNAPYGVAKRALLTMAQAYRAQYGLEVVSLIPANLYGPGDNFDLETSHVIPALIRKFVEAEEQGHTPVTLWGTGSATREFLYVDDAAEGMVLAAAEYRGEEPVNLGTGDEIPIAELAGVISAATGFEGEIVWDATRPDGQPRRRLDTSRAAELFGFRARTPLDEGIRTTVEWYRRSSHD